jgi:cytoskeleton protein RodZ
MSEVASNDLPEAEPHPAHALTSHVNASLGAQLAAARVEREWSVEHVASQLNLAPRQIQALEADNYGALPGMASVRGFVRAYAKLLKLDADPLVALIAGEQVASTTQLEPKRSVSAAPFSDNRSLSSGRRRNSPKTVLIGLVVVVLAIAAFNVERMGGWPVVSQSLSGKLKGMDAGPSASVQSEASASAKSDSIVESLPNPQNSVDAASATATNKPQEVKSEPAKPDVKTPIAAEKPIAPEVKPVAQVTESKPAAALPTPVAADTNAAKPVVTNAKNALVFNVRKDSWIEVRDAHSVLFSRMVKAGSTEQVEVTQPVSLIVGNAAGVDIVFRGAPVETKTDAKSNVARLSLK